MAITSGFTQCNRHPSLPSPIPSVLISQTFFVIALYNPKRDYFLQDNQIAKTTTSFLERENGGEEEGKSGKSLSGIESGML